MAQTTHGKRAAQLIKEFPDHGNNTLAQIIVNEGPLN